MLLLSVNGTGNVELILGLVNCQIFINVEACASTKLNKEYSKHDFWSMVPKEELYERKLRCVFQYSPPETGCGDKGLNN